MEETGKDKPQYNNENQVLRQMHLQRLKRIEKEARQKQDEPIESQQLIKMHDRMQEQLRNTEKSSESLEKQVLLNMVAYDKREQKPPYMINFFALFQDKPVGKAPLYISSNVESIVMTTFGFEMETFDFLLQNKIQLFIVNDSKLKQTVIRRKFNNIANLTVIERAGKNSGYGVSHTKLWLVKFKKFLRVVVCSSNQHILDWTVWLNSFWFQDFPLKSEPQQQPKEDKNQFNYNKDFEQTLRTVVTSLMPNPQYLQKEIGINLDHYHFDKIQAILVPSLQGRHTDRMHYELGMNKIYRVMKAVGPKFKKPIMTYASTSLGVIDSKFIGELYQRFCPGIGFTPERFRLVYPTHRYIVQETCQQAQILFLLKSNYEKSDLKDSVFYKFDTNPNNPILGCLSHTKIIFIEEQQGSETGVLFMGSHNATRAAWGKNQKNNSQIYICNEELGLVFMEYPTKKFKEWAPFKYPPEKYGKHDKPFMKQ